MEQMALIVKSTSVIILNDYLSKGWSVISTTAFGASATADARVILVILRHEGRGKGQLAQQQQQQDRTA